MDKEGLRGSRTGGGGSAMTVPVIEVPERFNAASFFVDRNVVEGGAKPPSSARTGP
jgi:hypothetical protein